MLPPIFPDRVCEEFVSLKFLMLICKNLRPSPKELEGGGHTFHENLKCFQDFLAFLRSRHLNKIIL